MARDKTLRVPVRQTIQPEPNFLSATPGPSATVIELPSLQPDNGMSLRQRNIEETGLHL